MWLAGIKAEKYGHFMEIYRFLLNLQMIFKSLIHHNKKKKKKKKKNREHEKKLMNNEVSSDEEKEAGQVIEHEISNFNLTFFFAAENQ